jgi:hypothetical protein
MRDDTCSVDGCGSPGQLRRGMCNMHYLRFRAHGSTDKPSPHCPKGHTVVIGGDGSGHCAACEQLREAQPAELCTIDDCTDPVLARGWCRKHYLRWYKLGSTDTPPRFTEKTCSVDGCDDTAIKHGWCGKHHARWKRHGTTDDPPAKPAACAVADCNVPPYTKGWCKRHYKLLTRQGTAHEMKRYALKCGSQTGDVDYAEILAIHGMVCHICDGEIPSRAALNFDHVIPLTRGGPHVQENILPSHKTCNVSKGNKLMSELSGR